MGQVWDPTRKVWVDDGEPPAPYAPGATPLPPPPNPPVARIGSQPMPPPDDVTADDLLTGNMSGAEAMRQRQARIDAAAAPTATGGPVIPSMFHGLPQTSPLTPGTTTPPVPSSVVPASVVPTAIPATTPSKQQRSGGSPATSQLPPATPSDQKERDTLAQDREDLTKDKASVAARQADINADVADRSATLDGKFQSLSDDERARFTADFQKRVADRDAAIVAATNAKPHSYFSNMSAGGAIVTALALAAGAYGAGASAAGGHPTGNLALQQLNTQIDQDFKKQELEIANLKDVAAMKRAGVTDAVQAHRILDEDLKDKKAEALASLIADGERKLKALGRTQVEIDSNVALNDLRTKLLDDRRTRAREDATDTLNRLTTQSNLETAKSQRAKNYAEANAAGVTAKAALTKAQNAGNGLAVRDPVTGEILGQANSPKSQRSMAALLANQKAYEDNLDELTAHIQKYGNLVDPTSPEYKERERLIGETVVKGQQVMGGNSSDERAKLEKQIIGGSGLGINRAASPQSLQNLKAESGKIVQYNLNANLTRSPDQIQNGQPQPQHTAQDALAWYRDPRNAKDPNYAAVGTDLRAKGLIR